MMTKYFLFFTALVCSSLCYADTLTLQCPDVSSLKKVGAQWTGLIPATYTSEKKPIPATLLTSAAGVNGFVLKIQSGATVDHVKKTITCSYNTETEPQNGRPIDLTGMNPDVFTFFSECHVTGGTVADPIFKINCTAAESTS